MKPLSPQLQRSFETVDAMCSRSTYAGRSVTPAPVEAQPQGPDGPLQLLFGSAAPHAERALEYVNTPTGRKFASVAILTAGAAVFPRL